MKSVRKKIFAFFILLFISIAQITAFSLFPTPALADQSLLNDQEGISEIRSVFGWTENRSDIRVIIVKIIQILLGLIGAIFVSLMVFAGFRYMTSAGNEEQTKKALAQIKDAVIGVAIVLSSWLITTAVLRYLTRAINNNVGIWER
jgi:hypothetical protein